MASTTGQLSSGVAAVFLLAMLASGCSRGDHDVCRYEPQHCTSGEPGAFCTSNDECRGICCTDKSNCASGMCTYACKEDRHCPWDMACEHDVCFYRCSHDDECAIGQKCEHGNTICEWP